MKLVLLVLIALINASAIVRIFVWAFCCCGERKRKKLETKVGERRLNMTGRKRLIWSWRGVGISLGRSLGRTVVGQVDGEVGF
jgi:hypothetical protein